MEAFGREVFHNGLEPLDALRLAQGEKVRCTTSVFHGSGALISSSFVEARCHGSQVPLP